MNFLAHLYLSGDNTKIMVGNFIGDFVKGRQALEKFEPEIVVGIELHRAIDEFTDTHPIVAESKQRLRPKYRHYSGVIVDVFYDHFLANQWSLYHAQRLPDFAAHAYRTLESFDAILPQEVKHLMPYMVKGNWLVNYAKVEGINRALTGMSQRTPYESKMDQAVADLEKNYDAFEREFGLFFPTLKKHTEDFLTAR
ncbi:MAG: ACP phosphodiesterase [Bacteroidota bacterium]